MTLSKCKIIIILLSLLPLGYYSLKAQESISKQEIKAISTKVADWQIKELNENPNARRDTRGWIAGALYVGMFDWAELSGDAKYEYWLRKIFEEQFWQVGDRMHHADYLCVAQTYLDFYSKHKEEKMIIPTLARVDWVLKNPSTEGMEFYVKGKLFDERWTWCDALFMAPSVYSRLYAITGKEKYMKFADKEFKATYKQLYDKEEHLFYRDNRFPEKREANGAKVFWGRGNGWVIAGLAEIIKTLPEKDKKYRPYYVALFKEMSEKLATLQGENGFWHASLLDPQSFPDPETSATGFNIYGLAYGINQGYLPKEKYLPIVLKGWKALCTTVKADGKLGWVQPVGDSPRKVSSETTELYGVGAFLMSASEVYKLAK